GFVEVSVEAAADVGDVRRRIFSAHFLGFLHGRLAHHGYGFADQSNRPRGNRVCGAADAGEFQPADQARRLLHAERLSGNSKSTDQGHRHTVDLDQRTPFLAQAVERSPRAVDLRNGVDRVFDDVTDVRVLGLVYLGDGQIR